MVFEQRTIYICISLRLCVPYEKEVFDGAEKIQFSEIPNYEMHIDTPAYPMAVLESHGCVSLPSQSEQFTGYGNLK